MPQGDSAARWRFVADRAKRSLWTLRLADHLGRGVGRFRLPGLRGLPPAATPDLANWGGHEAAAVWLGHASMLFRIAGLTVLADPVFSERIGLQIGPLTAGPRRRQGAALDVEGLPRVDVVVVSHAHFDHLDRPTLWRLARRFPAATVVTSANCADLLTDLGFAAVRELGWGETTTREGLTVTALETKHWGPRVFYDNHRSYGAFLLSAAGRRILYGSDSAYFRGWEHLAGSGGVDLACVGIGAYDPYIAAHATPEQAAEMARGAGARAVLPMHHSTFKLSHELMDEPLARFRVAAADLTVAATEIGAVWVAPRLDAVAPTGQTPPQ